MTLPKLDPFTEAYIRCALWSSTSESGSPLDEKFSIEDIDHESIIRMDQDCRVFQFMARDLLSDATTAGYDESKQGHDFWLTRNGHGTGFWDRDLGDDIGEQLTELCKQFVECYLYINVNEETGDYRLKAIYYG